MMPLYLFLCISCKKQDEWLNKKTTKSSVTPETLADYQAILDNTREMNTRSFLIAGLLASDNVQVPDEEIPAMGEEEENIYLWKDKIWVSETSFAWNYCYRTIEFANLVLDGLKGLPANNMQYNNVKGQAYFFRATAMYNLAQIFCKPYVEATANTELGIAIRETSDVNVIIRKRSSLKATYEKIQVDLQIALNLLPDNQPYFQRPNKGAANAFLAKLFLTMEDYKSAGKYADNALKVNNKLLDFNSNIISFTSTYPFPLDGVGNPEILFYATAQSSIATSPEAFGSSVGVIPKDLYDLYADDDLRKSVFFADRNGIKRLIGTYSGTFSNFSGIANNELYLIRAEAAARNNDVINAMDDINLLLRNRYITGTYQQQIEQDPEKVLKIILSERRKELPYTGNIRWEDIRRLNRDPRFRKTITRTSNGRVYTLAPDDKRYVFPIPENEIRQSGIEQNDR